MSRFLACGDLHIGQGAHLSATRLAEQEDAWRRILRSARDENVDALLFAGDLWERRRPTPEEYLAAERPLVEHRHAGGPAVIAINGNHDRAGVGEDMALDVLHEAGLVDLHREPGFAYVANAAVTFLPWAPVSRLRALLGSEPSVDELHTACAELLLRVAADARPEVAGEHVLMAHWSVDTAVLPSGMSVADLREVVLPLDELQALGFDAIVLAHIHKAQHLVEDGAPIFYVGSPLPLNFGEGNDPHGYWLIDTADRGNTKFMALDSPRFLTFDSTFEDWDDDDRTLDVEQAYVRVRLTAGSEGVDAADVRLIESELLARGAQFAKVEVTVERAARARVEQLDETVDEAQAFGMWLDSQDGDLDEEQRAALANLDSDYRARVAA